MFELQVVQGDGSALLDHVKALAAMGDPEEIDRLERCSRPPRHTGHVWAWFQDIAQTRQSNGMAVARLTRTEIAQWEADEGVALQPWERRAIIRVDAAFVAHAAAQAKPS